MRTIVLRFFGICAFCLIAAVAIVLFVPKQEEIRLLRVYEVCSDIQCYELEINGDTITACSLK